MILRFFSQPDSLHSQIFRKAGQKKAEPNRRQILMLHGSSLHVTFLWVGVPIELLIDIMTWGDISFAGRVTLGSYQIIIQKNVEKFQKRF
jgi:hypothetical protein